MDSSRDYKRAVVDYYRRHLAIPYRGEDTHATRLKRELVRRYSGKGTRTLSAGCGAGALEVSFAALSGWSVGLDLTADCLRRYREKLTHVGTGNVSLVNGDLYNPPFRRGSFDLVYSFGTLYNIREVGSVLAEIRDALRPEGTAVLEFANILSLNSAHSRWKYDCPQFFLTPRRIGSLLRSCGFKVEDKRYLYLVPSFLMRGPVERLLAAQVRGKSVDERISSLPILRWFACKVFVVARKEQDLAEVLFCKKGQSGT